MKRKRRVVRRVAIILAILGALTLGHSGALAFAHFKSSGGWVTSCGCTSRIGISTSFSWDGNMVIIRCKYSPQMCWVVDGSDLYIWDVGGSDPDVIDHAAGTDVERVE